MIRVLIPSQAEFHIYETPLRELYEKSQDKICDSNTFEFIRDNTFFYMFLDNDDLIGGIYYFIDNERLYLNGFAFPKKFLLNLECVKMSLNWFCCDIYAEAQNRASALCLLRCGFKRVEEKLFIFKKAN